MIWFEYFPSKSSWKKKKDLRPLEARSQCGYYRIYLSSKRTIWQMVRGSGENFNNVKILASLRLIMIYTGCPKQILF